MLLVRHAIAEERESFALRGLDDGERPLTERGRERMRGAAAGVASQLDALQAIASSPLVRAVQTADLLAERYPRAEREQLAGLAPAGDRAAVLAWLSELGAESCALVGHEPDMGELAGWLLTGRPAPFVEFKKGAACLLEFGRRPAAGGATLCWHLTPRQLRRLGRSQP